MEILESGAYTGQEGPFLILCRERELPVISVCMAAENSLGVVLTAFEEKEGCYMELKGELKKRGQKVTTFESTIQWKDFKTNEQGLVPVIVQDYRTDQVLMMAYMNEESYSQTICTGRMTYFSRSRGQLWVKGETSGHFQYVKSLTADCDMDTILAKVSQVGAACHTGARSCFFRKLEPR